jgi:hypothetical protein
MNERAQETKNVNAAYLSTTLTVHHRRQAGLAGHGGGVSGVGGGSSGDGAHTHTHAHAPCLLKGLPTHKRKKATQSRLCTSRPLFISRTLLRGGRAGRPGAARSPIPHTPQAPLIRNRTAKAKVRVQVEGGRPHFPSERRGVLFAGGSPCGRRALSPLHPHFHSPSHQRQGC